VPSAVSFASHYRTLVFFAHALEILLHTVVEDDDAEASARLLPEVVGFLDHFDEGLDVVVRCARKTEMTHWGALFDVAGSPEELFEVRDCPTLAIVSFSYNLTVMPRNGPSRYCRAVPPHSTYAAAVGWEQCGRGTPTPRSARRAG
jgi:hypothetical protein